MENWLQGIGLVVCIGGIIVLILGVVLISSLFRRREQGTGGDRIWRERGPESPRYDVEDVETRGGFGNAPGRTPTRTSRRGTLGGLGSRLTRRGGLGGSSRRSSGDDDDIRSRGGFGR
jgi:hypothetical protein